MCVPQVGPQGVVLQKDNVFNSRAYAGGPASAAAQDAAAAGTQAGAVGSQAGAVGSQAGVAGVAGSGAGTAGSQYDAANGGQGANPGDTVSVSAGVYTTALADLPLQGVCLLS